MLLVPSVQVKHQGSDQSPRLSVSVPSRSSFKVQVKVNGFRSRPTVSGKASMFRSPSYGHSFHLLLVSAIQVKCQGPDFPAMGIAIDVRRQGCDLPAKVIVFSHPAIDVRRQGSDLPAMVLVIQVNQQDSDLPSMCSANHVKRPGSHLPAMVIDCSVIQVKHLGSDRQSMVKAIQVKHQGSTRPSMVCSAIQVKHQGSDRPSKIIVFSYPGQASRTLSPAHGYKYKKHYVHILIFLIYLQSPAIRIKHQDSDLPAMGIDLIYLQSPAIQVKHQDSDLPAMGIVLNPPRSCFTDSDSVRGYRTMIKNTPIMEGQTASIKTQIWATVCLRSGYTMKNLFSFQCDRYIHLVRPLVTVGFISLLASQSKPAIMDPISVQCYSVLAVKVPLLSMPMIPNPSPIQSDSAFTAQAVEQGFLLHPRLQPRPIDPGLLSSRPKPTIKALIFFWAHSKRSMLGSTSKVAVHAENQGCTSKNRVKSRPKIKSPISA
ncbi:hypothetical protein F4703DRAFT_1797892 [Phycomyces blakesleeanus]